MLHGREGIQINDQYQSQHFEQYGKVIKLYKIVIRFAMSWQRYGVFCMPVRHICDFIKIEQIPFLVEK